MLSNDLNQLPFNAPYDKWVWAADEGLKALQPSPVTAKAGFINANRDQFRYELLMYCWCIYQITKTDTGEQIIGREDDTDHFSPSTGHPKYQRINSRWHQVMSAGMVNHMPGAQGNALKMDKWHPYMNDCWVLGGIHRCAKFKLVSTMNQQNIWNFPDQTKENATRGFLVVTVRELLGLQHFGYVPSPQIHHVHEIIYEPGEPAKALSATIADYNRMLDRINRMSIGEVVKKMTNPEISKLMASIRK